jgi:hypothetical protein
MLGDPEDPYAAVGGRGSVDRTERELDDLGRVWSALRWDHLRGAMSSRPERSQYVKELRYDVWLGDLEGWDEFLKSVWPRLEKAGIRLRERTPGGKTLPTNASGRALETAAPLRSLDIEISVPGIADLQYLLRRVPKLSTLTLRVKPPPRVLEDGYFSLLPIDSDYTLAHLSCISAQQVDHFYVPTVAQLPRRSHSLASFEITGAFQYDQGDPQNSIKPLLLEILSSKQLHTLFWYMRDYSFSQMLEFWHKNGKEPPSLVECGFYLGWTRFQPIPHVRALSLANVKLAYGYRIGRYPLYPVSSA